MTGVNLLSSFIYQTKDSSTRSDNQKNTFTKYWTNADKYTELVVDMTAGFKFTVNQRIFLLIINLKILIKLASNDFKRNHHLVLLGDNDETHKKSETRLYLLKFICINIKDNNGILILLKNMARQQVYILIYVSLTGTFEKRARVKKRRETI